ncbi:TonB family protein [Algicella marina]|uniref:TonB family protein n=1 Tax=Algicella marina TaxID=2683284 RepID=A0A6P1T8U2_9RHOB|nr:TonB family protein [Algicella marina]QHQ37042.1 TonB family protein [Algicella marina]
MRLLESALFLGLAAMLHIAVLGFARPDGEQAAGAGGDASITLTGSTGSLAAMVEEWTTPPEAEVKAVPPTAPDTPEAAPRAPAAQEAPSTPAVPVKTTTTSTAAPLPSRLPDALPLPAPPQVEPAEMQPPPSTTAARAPAVAQAPQRQPSPTAPPAPQPDIQPQAQAPAPPPASEQAPRKAERPAARPKTLANAAPAVPRRQPSTASAAQPRTQAKGQGGGQAAGTNGSAARSSPDAGNTASLMAQWGGQIQRAAQRNLVYPRKARNAGMTGRAIVRVKLGTSGQILARSIVQSSGNALLDRAALETLARVGRFPGAPQGISSGSHDFRIPVVFRGR